MRTLKRLARQLGNGTFLLLFCIALLGFMAPFIPVEVVPVIQLIPALIISLLPFHLVAFLIYRKKSGFKALMAATAFFLCLWVVGKDFTVSSVQKDSELKVISYNARNFNFTGNNIDSVISIIKPFEADVICFQEFRNYKHNGEGPRATSRVSKVLGMPYYHHIRTRHYLQGLAIFSRHPIAKIDTLYLYPDEANNGFLLTLNTPAGKVGVGNFHLSSFQMSSLDKTQNSWYEKVFRLLVNSTEKIPLHQQRVDRVLNIAADYPYPLILAADMNTVPHTRIASCLSQQFQDSFQEKGNGAGWTFMLDDYFGVRIDYLFATADLNITQHKVIRQTKGVSDHYPIMAGFQLP